MKLLLVLCAALTAADLQGPLQGAIFFTSIHTKELVRLDCGASGCSGPLVIGTGLESYGGLLPWRGSMLAALKSHLVVQVDPWCKDSSCPVTTLVDVERALREPSGSDLRSNKTYTLGGVTWCQDALFIVFGGQAGASGVLRCANCTPGRDCTSSCSLVDGGRAPGKGSQQLSGFAAQIACAGDRVLVTDNSNFRVQAIPAGCNQAPCDVETFADGLKWPLGIAVVGGGKQVLVTLDEGIVSLHPDGTSQHQWSSRGDSGFLWEGAGRVLVASGGDGNVVSLDPACEGPSCREIILWPTGALAWAGAAIAYMPRQTTAEQTLMLV